MMVKPRKLKGFRDFLPEQMTQRKQMIDTVWKKAATAGFEPIETPVLEYLETLLGSGGQESDKELYQFTDHGDRQVGMRFDLTVPFARFVAEHHGQLVLPFKKLQIGNSWRGEKPQKGRYREFCQADCDIIGVDSMAADIEVLNVILDALSTLIPVPFTMSLGNRLILSAILKKLFQGISDDEEKKALIILDKIDKIGFEKAGQLLLELDAANDSAVSALEKILITATDKDTDLVSLKALFEGDADVLDQIERLEQTAEICRSSLDKESKAKVKIDLKIARGLGYYTGIVFETLIDALPGFGSVSSGGRYNDLVNRFSKQSLPGIGGSIGVDRLLAAVEELAIKREEKRRGVYVAMSEHSSASLTYGFKLAAQLRQRCGDERIDIAVKPSKLAQQFKYADRKSFAHVVVIGDEELQSGTYSVKDLESGTEAKQIHFDALLKHCL